MTMYTSACVHHVTKLEAGKVRRLDAGSYSRTVKAEDKEGRTFEVCFFSADRKALEIITKTDKEV